jgi:hypothetical protein
VNRRASDPRNSPALGWIAAAIALLAVAVLGRTPWDGHRAALPADAAGLLLGPVGLAPSYEDYVAVLKRVISARPRGRT